MYRQISFGIQLQLTFTDMRRPGAAHNYDLKTSKHLNYADKTQVCFSNYSGAIESWFKPGARRPIKSSNLWENLRKINIVFAFPSIDRERHLLEHRFNTVTSSACLQWTSFSVGDLL